MDSNLFDSISYNNLSVSLIKRERMALEHLGKGKLIDAYHVFLERKEGYPESTKFDLYMLSGFVSISVLEHHLNRCRPAPGSQSISQLKRHF